MGLEWTPADKAKPGCELERAWLRWQLWFDWCPDRESKERRLREISMSALESLRAEHQFSPAREFQEAGAGGMIHRFNDRPMGSFVDRDGDPWFYNLESGEQVEMMSFRAKPLNDCVIIIGERLAQKALSNKSAWGVIKYAEELERALETYCKKMRRYGPEMFGREIDPMLDSGARLVKRAIDWCRFWGSRGHGIIANW